MISQLSKTLSQVFFKQDPQRPLVTAGTGIHLLMSYFGLFMLQITVVCQVHEYKNIYICEAFSNRAF